MDKIQALFIFTMFGGNFIATCPALQTSTPNSYTWFGLVFLILGGVLLGIYSK